jgi:hypothetical protein
MPCDVSAFKKHSNGMVDSIALNLNLRTSSKDLDFWCLIHVAELQVFSSLVSSSFVQLLEQ